MIKCSGKSVLKGIAIGRIYLYKKQEYVLKQETIENPEAEIERMEKAKETATEQLEALYQKALKEAGEEQAMIFDVHKMMLDDADYLDSIRGLIRDEKMNAEFAVNLTGENFAGIFASMDDEYMKARSADVLDISKRLIRILAGVGEEGIASEEPVVLLADDLSPSETVQMDKSKILAIVTKHGSTNSHTAILARSMNIPALVQTDVALLEEYSGAKAVVDGFSGTFIINPEEDVLEKSVQKKMEYEKERTALQELKGKDNVTTDGRRINLYANIGNVSDVDKVLDSDAGGIGLFRSEFIYLGREDYPTEEEQFVIYKEVLSRMQGKKVIIRTLDIGADKQVDYFKLPHEENPAMGYRAIRICLDRPEVFKTQLRAIYRASAFGTAAIMFPMIISVKEIRKIKEIVEEVKTELTKEGISFNRVELGIMVETPAATVISDELAKEVEFFSIGTNDLTQYTLAIDRQNQNLDNFYESHHEAILRLIKMTVENGHKEGIWVGICGELASDTTLTRTFVDMGVDELSVSPTYVLSVRKAVRDI
ncbi:MULTISPECIES: phosphoenolpyruvate--protein phosphotransferase [Eisenbergiella]|uniref:phosphoenolpyruvate--protein phosphotransferase n=1 Tax=Eisenbergiella TaxID=1432051 RepID=UPI0023F1A937|nr:MULTISPECIES: phosphoenolpyruvate--protein phosphotransferase [Eisenbergiella]MCI6707604.1 phosphoenolpyruvate--protein phosphotransferase [Eisenbergiella massiliensis]MDY5525305.1 phosphoenolpyruvate--protein phosphotransferase [Eisenbergiella porci]